MNILALDCSGKQLYVVAEACGQKAERLFTGAQTQHSQNLLPEVDALLKSLGAELSDMDTFCAVTGPGSFTGIRIGVTTVRAFAQCFGKPCIGVNSLRLRAYNVQKTGVLVPMTDAVRGSVYLSAYQGNSVLLPAAVCPLSEVAARVKSALPKEFADALFIYEQDIEGIANRVAPAADNKLLTLAQELLTGGGAVPYESLAPEYAELSQAEKLWASK